MRRQGLAISEDSQLRIRRSARLRQIGGQIAVEFLASLLEACVLALRIGKHLRHRQAFTLPIRAQLAAQVLDRKILCICQQNVTRDSGSRELSQGKCDREMSRVITGHAGHIEFVGLRQGSRRNKFVESGVR